MLRWIFICIIPLLMCRAVGAPLSKSFVSRSLFIRKDTQFHQIQTLKTKHSESCVDESAEQILAGLERTGICHLRSNTTISFCFAGILNMQLPHSAGMEGAIPQKCTERSCFGRRPDRPLWTGRSRRSQTMRRPEFNKNKVR